MCSTSVVSPKESILQLFYNRAFTEHCSYSLCARLQQCVASEPSWNIAITAFVKVGTQIHDDIGQIFVM